MQIDRHVHAIKVPFRILTPQGFVDRFVYVYLIYGTHGVCLIDTGVASAAEPIFNYLRSTDRKVSDISLIIQTHAHPDHIGASRTIKGETGCAVAAHPAERAWIENVQLQARERPVPDFDTLVAGSLAVNRLLGDGEVFDLGCGLKLNVLYTPGHSRGSLSILLLGYHVLFSGDAIPVPGELPIYEDVLASVASIKKLKAVKDIRFLLPSWDEPSKGAAAYEHMDAGLEYLQRVHDAVRQCSQQSSDLDPQKLSECVLQDLGLPSGLANPLVARTVAAHLSVRDQKVII